MIVAIINIIPGIISGVILILLFKPLQNIIAEEKARQRAYELHLKDREQ